MDKSKYSYWNKNIELNDEVVYREMYCRIGHIFHTIQMIEYNIANVLAIEKYTSNLIPLLTVNDVSKIKVKINEEFKSLLSNTTFGPLIGKAKEAKYLSDLDFDTLDKIKEYRDYLVHNCFKEKLMKNEFSTLEDVDRFIDELNDYESMVVEMNKIVSRIFKECKRKSILIKK